MFLRISVNHLIEWSCINSPHNISWVSGTESPEDIDINKEDIADNELAFVDTEANLVVMNVLTFTRVVMLSNITVKQYKAARFKLSPDRKFVLVQWDIRQVIHKIVCILFTSFESLSDTAEFSPIIIHLYYQ